MEEKTSNAPLRALICEDEGMTVMLLRQALINGGYEVVGEAPEGATAVSLALEKRPDFILMDINMPGMNGIEATRAIMEHYPVPIIMITAYSEKALVESAMEAGASNYLTKPIVSEQLLPIVLAALTRFDELQTLRKEVGTLQETLETRKIVEKAKGVLMKRAQLEEPDAFKRMQKMARDRCVTLKVIANEILNTESLYKQPAS